MSNKLYSEESIQAIANSIRAKNGTSETYTVSEMSTAISALPTNLTTKTITVNGTYNASSDDADGYSSVTVAVEGYAKKSIENTPTPIATFNASALPMPSLKIGIEAVQSGTGDPSPTNIRPFTGWSAVNVYRHGKNLIGFKDGTGAAGTNRTYTISNNTVSVTSSSNVVSSQILAGTTLSGVLDINLFKAGTYKLSISNQTGFTETIQFVFKYSDNTNITVNDGDTFTLSSDATLVSIVFSTSVSWNTKTLSFNAQIERGEEATTYEPYQGTTTPIQFVVNGETKTIYSGYVEIKNGKVKAVAEDFGFYLADLDWTQNASLTFGFNGYKSSILSQRKVRIEWDNSSCFCEGYKGHSSSGMSSGQIALANAQAVGEIAQRIYVTDNRFTSDVEGFVNWITSNPIKCVLPLATPIEYDLADVSISTQDGINNIWADSGDVLEGSYFKEL